MEIRIKGVQFGIYIDGEVYDKCNDFEAVITQECNDFEAVITQECNDFEAVITQNRREYEGVLAFLRNEEQKRKGNIDFFHEDKIYKLNKMLNEKVLNTLEVLKNDRNRKGSR